MAEPCALFRDCRPCYASSVAEMWISIGKFEPVELTATIYIFAVRKWLANRCSAFGASATSIAPEEPRLAIYLRLYASK